MNTKTENNKYVVIGGRSDRNYFHGVCDTLLGAKRLASKNDYLDVCLWRRTKPSIYKLEGRLAELTPDELQMRRVDLFDDRSPDYYYDVRTHAWHCVADDDDED